MNQFPYGIPVLAKRGFSHKVLGPVDFLGVEGDSLVQLNENVWPLVEGRRKVYGNTIIAQKNRFVFSVKKGGHCET